MAKYNTLFNMYMSKALEASDEESKKLFHSLAKKTALRAKCEAISSGDCAMLEMSEQMLECV